MAWARPVVFVSTVILLSCSCFAQDSDGDGIADSVEASLADRFAPVLRLSPGEAYLPVAIQYALENSELRVQQDGASVTIQGSPTVESISAFKDPDSKYFLDNVHGGIDDQGVKESFKAARRDLKPTVYARVTRDSSYTVVQYWFYYPFNDGPLNTHEGDWEMVQVLLEAEEPVSVAYSQHFSGEKAAWKDVLLRRGHPVVYVAKGSHANYFRSYQGVLGAQNDEVSGLGPALEPDAYELVLFGEMDSHPSEQAWLEFAGRWGDWGEAEDQLRGRRGPSGPGHGENAEKWQDPSAWQAQLPELESNWLWLSWIVSNFAILFGIYLLLRGSWKLFSLGKAVLDRQTLKGVGLGSALAIIGAVLTVIAIWQPWYFVKLKVPAGEYKTAGDATVVIVDGAHGLQISDPQSNKGLVTLMGLKMPIGLIFVSGLVFLVLDIFKAKAPAELRGRFVRGGITNLLVPVVPMVIFIMFAGPVVSAVVSSLLDREVPQTVSAMLESVSRNPLGGTNSGQLPEIGNAELKWGLGTGGIMVIGGGVLKVIGGLASRRRGPSVSEKASPEVGPRPPDEDTSTVEGTRIQADGRVAKDL